MAAVKPLTFTFAVKDITCPTCGAKEMHPDGKRLLVRGFKILTKAGWWSQCLVCSGHYDKDLTSTPENHKPLKGWFV